MRIRLVHTLALWFLAAVGVSVLAMGVWVSWHLGQGFTAYLLARDVARLELLAEVVADNLRQAGGVGALHDGRLRLQDMLRDMARREGVAPEPRPGPGPDSRHGERPGPRSDPRDGPPPPPGPAGRPADGSPRAVPIDGMRQRVALFEPDGRPLQGRPLPPGNQPLLERPVLLDGSVVALLRMRPVDRLPGAEEMNFLHSQRQGITGVAVLLVTSALLLAWWLARRWAKPLRDVQDATARIAHGELGVRVPSARSDEIGDVARNVNLMAQSLQRMESARRRWIADMSHELRTPLAGLRGEVEALVDGVRPFTHLAALSLREDVLRLGKLVDDLHLLAMHDLHSLPCRFVDADAVQIVQDSLRRFAVRAQAAGLTLDWMTPPPAALSVVWDPDRIEQLLANLLENSLRYTDSPGRVGLALRVVGDTVRISIDDSAPGAGSADMARLFEPLFRADAARSRHTGGSGLGLAICQAICQAHRGHISVKPSTLGGLQMLVSLPIEAQPSAIEPTHAATPTRRA